jgi:hypothetical protein
VLNLLLPRRSRLAPCTRLKASNGRGCLCRRINQFVELEKGKPIIDMEEAYIMYVALTRAREKLLISPACVEAIAASAARKAGSDPTKDSRGVKNTVQLRWARFHRRSPERSN